MSIHDLNIEIRGCGKCRLSGTRAQVLCGEGDLDARLMLIAQAPGENEDKEGRMFIGPSGKVLDELLGMAHVGREEIYMTNLIKCMLPKNRRPKQNEIDTCGRYLDREIEMVDPEILAPLGYYATCYIFRRYSLPLPSRQEFHTICGRLLLAGNRKVLPLQHPAAMLHDPRFEDEMVKDYHKLGVVLTDCKWYPLCPMKRYHEAGRLDGKWVGLYCKGDWESCIRFQMEENREPHADWMLPDGTIDEGLRRW